MTLEYWRSRNDITSMYTLKEVDIDSLYSTSKKLGVFDMATEVDFAMIMHLSLPLDTEFDWGNGTTSGIGYTNNTLRMDSYGNEY